MTAHVTHGSKAPALVAPQAMTAKRRLLRNLKLKHEDLDALGRARLDLWSRAAAKIVLMDRHFDKHGFLDEHGNPHPAADHYLRCLSAANRTLDKLESHFLLALDEPVADLQEAGRLVRLAAQQDDVG